MLERAEREYVSAYFITKIHLGLGNHERALDRLEEAREERSTWFFLIKVDPILKPLQHEPRFQQLVRRMNFPE